MDVGPRWRTASLACSAPGTPVERTTRRSSFSEWSLVTVAKGRGVECLETPEERGGRGRRSPPGDRSLGRLVVLAERYRIDRVLTLDHRHFRLIRTSAGKTFTVLPRLG